MNEELDAMRFREHEDGADDNIDVTLAGRSLSKGADDRGIIHHEDDPLMSKMLNP